MQSPMFSIRDDKVGRFHIPLCSPERDTAKRHIGMMTKDENLQMHHYPEDFSLHMVGVFDDENGHIIAFEQPEFIISASAVKNAMDIKNMVSGTPVKNGKEASNVNNIQK